MDLADPLASLLLRKISYQDEYNQMPPTGPLPEAERAVLRQWVQRGIPWSEAVDIEESAREAAQDRQGDGLEELGPRAAVPAHPPDRQRRDLVPPTRSIASSSPGSRTRVWSRPPRPTGARSSGA